MYNLNEKSRAHEFRRCFFAAKFKTAVSFGVCLLICLIAKA